MQGHILEICTFHDGCKQGTDQQIFRNRSGKSIRERNRSAKILEISAETFCKKQTFTIKTYLRNKDGTAALHIA